MAKGFSMKQATRSVSLKKILRTIFAIALITIMFWGIQWATFARPPLPEAIGALENDDLVTVTVEPWITFSPAQITPTTGFIFYPGGRIDPRGYAPLMREIASEGYLIVVPGMPLNMAPFDANAADDIQAYFPEIQHWVIGGHSVGGTMAAQFTDNHPGKIDGLVIWASYPANNVDLTELPLPVTLIYGSLDPRVNAISVAERQALLPPHSHYVPIEGGDHHQFGSYEISSEEQHATISQNAQHRQIIESTLALLSEVQH
jgi:predicted esterase